MAAVRRHWRRREQLDEACREACRARDRARYATNEHRREYLRVKARAKSRSLGFMPKSSRPLRRCRVCDEEFVPANGRHVYCSGTCLLMAMDLMSGKGGGILRWQLASPAERDAMLGRLVEFERSPWHELRVARYGLSHAAERRRRLDERGPDARCARCGELLPEDDAGIDLDHDDDDPTRYLGLSCVPCNRGKRPVVAELLAG